MDLLTLLVDPQQSSPLFYWFGGCYQDDFFMPIKEPRDANPQKTRREIRKNSYTERGEGDPWKYIGFLLVQRNSFLATWTTSNDVCLAYH